MNRIKCCHETSGGSVAWTPFSAVIGFAFLGPDRNRQCLLRRCMKGFTRSIQTPNTGANVASGLGPRGCGHCLVSRDHPNFVISILATRICITVNRQHHPAHHSHTITTKKIAKRLVTCALHRKNHGIFHFANSVVGTSGTGGLPVTGSILIGPC